jgi:hypothetical protein
MEYIFDIWAICLLYVMTINSDMIRGIFLERPRMQQGEVVAKSLHLREILSVDPWLDVASFTDSMTPKVYAWQAVSLPT